MPNSVVSRLTESLQRRLKPIKAVLLDVEGVILDGTTFSLTQGLNTKAIHPEDVEAIHNAIDNGIIVGIITSRASHSVDEVASRLKITDVYQGYLNKSSAYEEFKFMYNLTDDEIAYMGDDILDLSVIKMVGFSAAPFNAHSSIRIAAHFVTKARGGSGAISEMFHLLFAAQQTDIDTPANT